MEDFNWVAARCECSPGQVFEKLKSQVQNDIMAREIALSQAQRQRYTFEFIPGSSDFKVLVSGNNIHGAIKFALTETGIVVFNEEGARMFSADVTISDEGECKLKIDDEEKELWQVRKMALENLFFARY
jgi:hypothetical protein